MRIAVTGASGVIGRGVVARLLSRGHDVVGLARNRPESWPSSADFAQSDIRDVAGVRRAVTGTDIVVHCAWAVDPAAAHSVSREINIGGTANVLDAMAQSGTRRIVFASSAHVYGADQGGATPLSEADPPNPVSAEGRDVAGVEEMLAASGAEWVAIRSAAILGRGVDNWVRRVLASPFFSDIDADRSLQVVHSDDVHRVFVQAVVDTGIGSGPVNLGAQGESTLRQIAGVLGRPVLPVGKRLASSPELDRLLSAPSMDTALLRDKWNFTPAWSVRNAFKTSRWRCAVESALASGGVVALAADSCPRHSVG